MNIVNIRIPEEISFAAEGGPNFLTNIISSSPGKEFRNSKSIIPFSKYLINYSKLSHSMMQNLLSFFYIVKGRAFSFRFKDFLDFKADLSKKKSEDNLKNFFILSTDVSFEGENWAFCLQFCKNYFFPFGAGVSEILCGSELNADQEFAFYRRKITKPIKSTVKFWEILENSSPSELTIEQKDFKIDETSGLLYLKNKIDLEEIDITFEFDVCVRFSNDFLKISNSNPGIFNSEAIELLEVFE
jgi:hypothetical protein